MAKRQQGVGDVLRRLMVDLALTEGIHLSPNLPFGINCHFTSLSNLKSLYNYFSERQLEMQRFQTEHSVSDTANF